MTETPRTPDRADFPVRLDAVPGGWVWRVTASNGRSIARSGAVFAAPEAARVALEELVRLAATRPPTGTIGHRPGGGWGWTILDRANRPVAHSPRTFERRGSCARSLQRFREALALLD